MIRKCQSAVGPGCCDPEHARHRHLISLFGHQAYHRIKHSSVLVVGAGGIGCELLKNLVCTGFGHITLIDLDTVDASNLNRQFLFQKRHVKRPKAIVARETALSFNPQVKIEAFQANITDPEFDQAHFKKFDLILNALDNLVARRHVNKLAVATKVPLIESGTAGYTGQVQPIRGGQIECYDCHPKPLPKTFPVCTIRSTPSSPIHCIVWAKGYLFPQLFGPEDENEGADLDEAIQNGESVVEVENLKAELQKMREIRSQLNSPEVCKIVFKKVFEEDIHRLLMMEDMWKHRLAPVPLDYDQISIQTKKATHKETNHHSNPTILKDQQSLSLEENFGLFCSSLLALGKRIEEDPNHDPLSWDKDDDDALDFVTAAANLRATIFGISQKTRFEIKEMAGNIIPAIATTNSAVSALMVLQAINLLASPNTHSSEKQARYFQSIDACRPWYHKTEERIILPDRLDLPNPSCPVCQVVYSTIQVSPDCTLSEFILKALKGKIFEEEGDEESITIQEGDRLLYDPDLIENGGKSFQELGLCDGVREKVLHITEESEKYVPLLFTISKIPLNGETKIIVGVLPEVIPNRPKVIETQIGSTSDVEEINSAKLNNGENKRNRMEKEISIEDDSIVVVNKDNQLDIASTSQPPIKKLKVN
ncbi:hypothetical protein O181_016638 [Austropuccinia psidii MF-1]|uniref:Ubiquitin-activating enzyme E1-like n=1 Tax=Austropuccinia psidii MF-1 TaxID=1389203 RepID=A0A9Q3C5K1_9BASI|nr:hypothetical protein [Austropuccinia psidii MF-1]